MKKLKLLYINFCLLTAAALLLFSCSIRGKGDLISKTFEIVPFNGIVNNIEADIHITQAPTQTVEIVAQSNIINNISLEVTDGIMTIDFIKKNTHHFYPININISIPELSSLNLNSSGNIFTTNTFDSCGTVKINISGSGNIDAYFNANTKTYTTISGSGNLNLTGNSPDHDITIEGSGNVHTFPFYTYHTVVNIAGSGNCELTADSTLNVTISGSGNVNYKGHPVIHSTITGSGTINNSN